MARPYEGLVEEMGCSCYGPQLVTLLLDFSARSRKSRGHIMGDKNPKTNKKNADQKKSKSDGEQTKKDSATAAKQAEKTKK